MVHAPLAVTFSVDHDLQQLAYDVIILLVLIANVAAGIRHGLIRRAISLAGVFGAAASATWLGNSVAATVSSGGLIDNAWGFLTTFLVVIAMIEVLSMLYSEQIERTASLAFDRVAGALMGVVVGLLQVGMLVVLVLAVGDAQPGPGRNVPPNHAIMAGDLRQSSIGGLFAQADGGLRSMLTPVLPNDLPNHLVNGPS